MCFHSLTASISAANQLIALIATQQFILMEP